MDAPKSELTLISRTRRELLKVGGLATIFHAFPLTTLAETSQDERLLSDLAILNVALGLEHQALAAYKAGAESGLLSGNSLELALACQKDHKRHRDVIIKTINQYGGKAVDARQEYDFGALKRTEDILMLAHNLEQEAVDAYLANAAKLQSSNILNAAVAILVDEVRHATNFKMALGISVTVRPSY
jgi:hypothetical protein